MIRDIHDEEYKSPLKALDSFKFTNWQRGNSDEPVGLLRTVAFVISIILLVFYLMGIYFTYIDSSEAFDKTWNNDERMKQGGLGKRDL